METTQDLIMLWQIINRFQHETSKHQQKKLNFVVMPHTKIWEACEKVVPILKDNNFNPSVYVLSRFHSYNEWAVKRFRVKSLPASLLPSPKPIETYKKYVKFIKSEDNVSSLLDAYIKQIDDGYYLQKKLNLSDRELLCYPCIPPYYLAVSTYVINRCLCSSDGLREYPKIRSLVIDLAKNHQLFNKLRDRYLQYKITKPQIEVYDGLQF